LAAVVKRPDESISELLTRLDEAIQKAWDEDVYIDEVNQ
jgi:CRISPR/Cas system CSM-associated protein Csm2 small subunit